MPQSAPEIVPVQSPDQTKVTPKIDPNLNLLQVLNQILAMNPPKTNINQATPDQEAAGKATDKQGNVQPVDPKPVAAKESASSRKNSTAALPDVVSMPGMGDPVAAAGNAIQAAAAAGQNTSTGGISQFLDTIRGKSGSGGKSKDALSGILKIAALFG